MNVYDFDKTIYNGDSTSHFIKYLIKKHPRTLLNLPRTVWEYLLYIAGVHSKTEFKEKMYGMFRYVDDIDKDLEDFWKKHKKNIKDWYIKQKRDDDLIISASPEFLLEPMCEELGVSLIASVVDKKTGKYTGENCHGEEKVRRMYTSISEPDVEEFYSDSLSDTPLANEAQHAFLVNGDERISWEGYVPGGKDKLREMFLSGEFLMFLIIGVINTVNGVLFSWLYSRLIPDANISFCVGYVTATIISYILNSIFTFKERLSFVRYIKFVVSYIPNFIVQNLIVMLVYNILHMHELVAYALAAVIGVPVTFFIMKIFAFKKK